MPLTEQDAVKLIEAMKRQGLHLRIIGDDRAATVIERVRFALTVWEKKP